MDHPKCKLCGTKHPWLGNCPAVKGPSEEVRKKIDKQFAKDLLESFQPKDPTDKIVSHQIIPVDRSTTGDSKFDRNAYQRVYMRAWRAKKGKD